MFTKAIQDLYPPEWSHCYGCGVHNEKGHQLKSYWDGETVVAHFTPAQYYSGGVPDHIYGGLIASLLDCHGTASAAAFAYVEDGQELGDDVPAIRCVTASLKVDFKRPTPMGEALMLVGSLRSLEGRKIWVDLVLSAQGLVCAQGELLAIRLKESAS